MITNNCGLNFGYNLWLGFLLYSRSPTSDFFLLFFITFSPSSCYECGWYNFCKQLLLSMGQKDLFSPSSHVIITLAMSNGPASIESNLAALDGGREVDKIADKIACLRGLMTCIYDQQRSVFFQLLSLTPFSQLCCAVCCLIVGEVFAWVCSPWKWLLFALCKLCHFVMNVPFSSAFWCSNTHGLFLSFSVTGEQ